MKQIYIITDLMDPEKGSEFRIGLKAIEILCNHEIARSHSITLFVPVRKNNIENIQKWLNQQNIFNLKIKEFAFKRAQFNGNHSTRLHFLFDLLFFYKNCRKEIARVQPPDSVIIKSGQVNWIFNLLFFLTFRKWKAETIVCAPISGFNYIKLRDCIHLSLKSKAYYLFYNLVIWCGRLIFKYLLISRNGYHFLFATYNDCRIFYKDNIRDKIYSEIELSERTRPAHDPQSGNQYDQKPENISVLWAGHLVPRKNPLLAVSIISHIIRNTNFVNFYFVGKGPLKKVLDRQLEKENLTHNKQFTYLSTLPRSGFLELLDKMNFVLITSVREVNSSFFLESLLANKRVVALRNSGLVDFNLDNVTLYDSSTYNSVKKLANAFCKELDIHVPNQMEGYAYIKIRYDYEKENFAGMIISALKNQSNCR